MLKIHNEFTRSPECTYVSGWFNGKLFEFNYYNETEEFYFGTTPLIDGMHVSCEPLTENEQKLLISTWLTR